MDTLIVKDGEAIGLARTLAERRGSSTDEVVVASLRAEMLRDARRNRTRSGPVAVPSVDELTPEQRARYDALRALVREMAIHRLAGATSDHGGMYDENGLPI